MTFKEEVQLVKSDTKIAINHVKSKRPDCIRFVIDDSNFKSICLYIKTGSFDTMIMCYGYLFTLALLEYFIEIEFYEKCAEIINCIDRLNEHTSHFNIPKTLPV